MEVVLVLFAVVFVAAVVFALAAAAQRRKLLAAWARAHGLRFDPDKDRGVKVRFGQFDCLRRGHSQYAHNRISGQWHGREFLGFDYHYEVGHGKGRQTHTFSAVILRSTVPLKPLFIRPEGLVDKVTEFFGYDDIDFESAEFSRKFYVRSPDNRWAYDVIHPRTMEFLLRMPRFTIKLDGQYVIVYRSRRYKPEDFAAAAKVAEGILDRLPDYLVRQLTGQD